MKAKVIVACIVSLLAMNEVISLIALTVLAVMGAVELFKAAAKGGAFD